MKKIMALVAALALAGCSGNPGDTELRTALDNAEGSLLKLTSVERVNGYEQGDNNYVIEANAEYEFTDSYDNLLASTTGFDQRRIKMAGMFYGEFDKGDTYSTSYTVTFVDSENGWQPINVE